MVKIKHFYNTADFSLQDINNLLFLALNFKKGKITKKIAGKILVMLFFNPSLRTRVSFSVAIQRLGGLAIDLPVKDGAYSFEFTTGAVMDQGTIEHVKDAAKVLSNYCNVIAIRASDLVTSNKDSIQVTSWPEVKKDKIINAFMKYADIPVINMESNVYHPCQGLGDAMTIKSKISNPKSQKYVLSWVPHPKALPMATPNSQLISACELGMNVTVVQPSGWELDDEILKQAQIRAKQTGGSLSICNDQNEALKEARVVCAKSWGALKFYGNWEKEKELGLQYKDWIINKEKMSITNNAYFMHCLPVRRNVEVTDDVIDGKNSLVLDQAENRLWVQMAILSSLLNNERLKY